MTRIKIVALIALLGLLTAIAPISAAQSTPEATAEPVTLVPFSDASYGIQGVVPEGWSKAAPGAYARRSSPQDITLIAQQSAQAASDVVLTALLPQLGLKTAPDSVGTQETAFATWTLYKVDAPVNGMTVSVDLALAQKNNTTYLVLLQASSAEYAALHDSVFLPALDAYTLIEATAEPTDYRSEDVTFENGDVTLAGTLTMPSEGGPFPAVVLVTGSGPQNRDELLGGGIQIAPFALIADALTRAGIAVLRYDDRGVASSTGDFASATTPDFASDAKAAVDYLTTRSEIDAKQIGLLGHSEGGLVGAMLGASDSQLAFVILLAGPAVDGKTLLDVQNRRILEASGASEEAISSQIDFLHKLYPLIDKGDVDAINQLIYQQALEQAKSLTPEQLKAIGDVDAYAHNLADQQSQTFKSGWFKSFLNYDPGPDLAKVHIPALALYGGKDVQVDAAQNAPVMTSKLIEAGNRDFSVVVLPNANHLFQDANTGSPQEYGSLPAKFTPSLLPTIIDWIHTHTTTPA